MIQNPYAEQGTSPPTPNPYLEAALSYAEREWAVFPLAPGTKQPTAGSRGFKDATTDAGQIRSWWTDIPDANIGIATGKVSGLTVLDVDTKPDKNGYASLEALELSGVTPMQMTQSGGMQYFFVYDPAVGNSVGKIGEGLDTKGDGGYVVAPPSQVNGNPYTWVVPPAVPLAPIPAVIFEKLKAAAPVNGKRPTEEWQRILKGVGEGSRQSELVRVAGKYYGSALDPVLARQSVHAWNAQNNPPLSREEVDACCDRIEQKEEAKGSTADVMPLTTVDMAPVPWLWPGYLPQGAVTLLVGDPGKGKTLSSLDLAARVSAGKAWPDGLPNTRGPASVIVMTAEDDLSYTVRPRVEAAGADSSKVFVLQQTLGPTLSLVKDLDRLETAITRTGATLLIIDPLSAYLPGIDTNKDNEVRSKLAPFVALAQKHGVTVVGIVHMSKNIERSALQRILGSTAFSAMARATFMVAPDPEDADRRLFLPVKFNLGPSPKGLAFRPVGAKVQGIDTVRAEWEAGTVDAHPDEVLRRLARGPSDARQLEAQIRDALADGPVLVTDIVELTGKPERTLRRCRNRLCIDSVRDPADTVNGPYFWLPAAWGPKSKERREWMAARAALRVPVAARGEGPSAG